MTEMTSYETGTPCWVDLSTPDMDASVSFYEAVFGWSIPEGPKRRADRRLPPGDGRRQAGRRGGAADAGGSAARLVELRFGRATPRQPPQRSRTPGGTVMVEPMEVMDLGTMAVFTDPTGAVFGVWQPGTFPAPGLVNEPGSLSWNELNTRDPEAAKAFYGAVFGWSAEDTEMPERGNLHQWHPAGRRGGRRHARHRAAGSRMRFPPTGWSTSPSPIAMRPWRRSRSWGASSPSARWTSRWVALRSSATPTAPTSR